MSEVETIKVEIPISRRDLKLLAPSGKLIASRDDVRAFALQAYHDRLSRMREVRAMDALLKKKMGGVR